MVLPGTDRIARHVRPLPGAGSLYWLATRDATGAYLDGGRSYTLDVPQPVPAKLFWSITVYDARTRSEIRTGQGKAAIRSLFELADTPADEPVRLRFGPEPPAGSAADGRWIQTLPGVGWGGYCVSRGHARWDRRAVGSMI